ncbi:polymorphic toxin type 28 domain-containing protein [Streptomyces parvus]|uniref:polymorphic toxin type 28 domain-containing protein n=1 Tax=Streptomyces parvus TaxID=66428 RepID=UPI003D703EEB
MTTPDGVVWCYKYDALGRRIAKQRLAEDGHRIAEETTFTWDGVTLCEEVLRGESQQNSISLTWEYKGIHPVMQSERILDPARDQEVIDSRFFAIIIDIIGTPKELIAETADIAWSSQSPLWGETSWLKTSDTYTPLRFPGQYCDPESRLHYNLNRYYSPECGRYLTQDPLGITPSLNPSSYVGNPTTWIDPLGLSPYESMGFSKAAQHAFEKLQNIKKDPLGEINSQPNHNHYDAARREAQGEVVARKADGTPFDHIADLKQARNGLEKIRKVIELEMKNLPDTLTERGLDVLLAKRTEVNRLLNNLNGFLHSIGHR